MGIRNRNIDANAKIAMSKIDQAFGDRVFFEDFEEVNLTAAEAIYGFDVAATIATSDAYVNQSESALVVDVGTAGGGGAVGNYLVRNTGMFGEERNTTFRTRLYVTSIADVEYQFGFGDAAALAAATDPVGGHDVAYWEFDSAVGATWRLATQTGAGGFTYVDSGITVAASTKYNLEVKLLGGGRVAGKINDDVFYSAVGAIKTGTSDWQTFVRAEAKANAQKQVYMDTWYVSETRR